jgi:hypothetical protein
VNSPGSKRPADTAGGGGCTIDGGAGRTSGSGGIKPLSTNEEFSKLSIAGAEFTIGLAAFGKAGAVPNICVNSPGCTGWAEVVEAAGPDRNI